MQESERLPKKFVIPIILLVSIALLIPFGNILNNSFNDSEITVKDSHGNELYELTTDNSEAEKWSRTIVIAIFALSFSLAGLIMYAVINNPSIINQNKDETTESMSFNEREIKLNSKK